MLRIPILTIISILFFIGCTGENGKSIFSPQTIEPPKVEDRSNGVTDNNIGRSSWQKPQLIINKLGDIEGKNIADIGSGTGYFVYRMALEKANVIAIDIDTTMINFVNEFKENLPEDIRMNVSTRLATYSSPRLKDQEVDRIILINTASYIEGLNDYLSHIKPSLKPGGMIMIVDYKSKLINIPAPPIKDRLAMGTAQTYLANSGYKNIELDESSLEYQYIITAYVE